MTHTTTNPAWYLEAWRNQARHEWLLEQLCTCGTSLDGRCTATTQPVSSAPASPSPHSHDEACRRTPPFLHTRAADGGLRALSKGAS